MQKVNLKYIKDGIKKGIYQDITTKKENLPSFADCEKVAFSAGIYGINGGILKNIKNGEIYAISARTSNLFRYF